MLGAKRRASEGWVVGGGLTSHPIPRSLASRCLRPSPRGSCSRRHPRTPDCPPRGSRHPASCAPRARAPPSPRTSGRGCRCRRTRGGGSRRGSVRIRWGWWWSCPYDTTPAVWCQACTQKNLFLSSPLTTATWHGIIPA